MKTVSSHNYGMEHKPLLISEQIYYKIIDISENKSTSFGSQGGLILPSKGIEMPSTTASNTHLDQHFKKVQLSHLGANQLHLLPGFHALWSCFPPPGYLSITPLNTPNNKFAELH